jgi:ribulose kinase
MVSRIFFCDRYTFPTFLLFTMLGLEDLVENGFEKIGRRVGPIGHPVGSGLTPEAALALGLKEGTPVALGLIDAHAGGVGAIGAPVKSRPDSYEDITERLVVVAGTRGEF